MHSVRYRPALVAIVCVLGFMLATAFNTHARSTRIPPERAADLAGVIDAMERQRDDLQLRLAGLRSEVEVLDRQAAEDAGVRGTYARQLEEARRVAGLSPASGPGIEVTLSDASNVPAGEDPNDYLIHDFDVTAIVNALLAGGAQAVSVNGERVTSATSIRCAGTTILANSKRLASPYVVLAVGDPEALVGALGVDRAAKALIEDFSARYGLGAAVQRKPSLTVEAYQGSLQPSWAKSAEEGAR